MGGVCFFCKRAPIDHECEVCKRNVCIQCSGSGNHNCYPRRWQGIVAEGAITWTRVG